MEYELILSDFDGTLLRTDLTVDKSVADAIRGYINRGGHFVVCTGRMAKSMDGWLDYLGIGGQRIAVVGFQGSFVADTAGNVLYECTVPHESVDKILAFAENHDLYTHFYDKDYVYIKEENPINLEYRRITEVPLKAVGNLRAYLKAHPELGILKVMIVVDPAEAAKIFAECEKEDFGEVDHYMSSESYLEFASKDGGKGTGLKKVAELYGVPIEKTIAIGDSQNDISMLEAAGLGVAVGNARADVKAAADYVTVTNDEGAAKAVIEKFCGGNE